MVNRRSILLLALAASLTACRPVSSSVSVSTPAPTPPLVQAFTQFSPGDTLELVQIQLGLDNYEVRYRSSMPLGEMGMVYFLDDGNLHVDAKKIGDTWVILSVPLLEPSTIPAAERAAEWDRAADPQKNRSRSQM
jgi:ABC-type glycerol-3-phosphate transport system substrate-binding protein